MELSLGDLLDHGELGLRLLTGDAAARDRRVRGAHSIEITPTRWVPKDWVMLTNGLRLRGRPAEQRRLVAELDAGGQAALGWAVGTVTKHVPRAIVDEARRRSFPVFLVPLETAFHQIVSFLGRATAHEDVYVLHRVADMTDYLLDALGTAKPEQATVRRLASLLDAEVLLTTGAGDPVEASGATPAADAQRYQVRTPHAGDRVLVVSPSPESHEQVTRPLVQRAVQQLELLARREAKVVAASRAAGAALLRRCLDGDQPTADAEAAALGLDVTSGICAAVWPGDDAPLAALDASGVAYLLLRHGGDAVGVVPEAQLGRLTCQPDGVGGRVHTLRDVRGSVAGAYAAVLCGAGHADALDPVGRIVAVAAGVDGALASLCAVLDPLRDRPHLLDTVRRWLAVGCDSARAAAELHLHRNTLRYRLGRAGRLTGLTVTEPRAVANLQLALLADDLRFRLPGPAAGGSRAD